MYHHNCHRGLPPTINMMVRNKQNCTYHSKKCVVARCGAFDSSGGGGGYVFFAEKKIVKQKIEINIMFSVCTCLDNSLFMK